VSGVGGEEVDCDEGEGSRGGAELGPFEVDVEG